MTLGELIAQARKEKNLSQRELAARIKKEDGTPISAAYVNDIEHDRRAPASHHMIEQFALALGIESEILYFLMDRIPPYKYKSKADRKLILNAWRAFERALQGGAT
jgi:transcriptional regulator with XRE-family HTH domain